MRINNIVYFRKKSSKFEKKQKRILGQQCNTTKAKFHHSNRETKKEQNNYQMWIQKIQEQIDTEADKRNIEERHNSSKLS